MRLRSHEEKPQCKHAWHGGFESAAHAQALLHVPLSSVSSEQPPAAVLVGCLPVTSRDGGAAPVALVRSAADSTLEKCLASWLAVPGVLVLSEFAGAAQSLGAGAILVNPWNITDMAAAIEDALTMSEQVMY